MSSLRPKLEDDESLAYIAQRFLSLGDLDAVALELGLKAEAFDELFAQDSDLEDKFNAQIEEMAKRRMTRTSFAGAQLALKTLHSKMGEIEAESSRDTVQACTSLLNFHRQWASSTSGEKDEIDELFSSLNAKKKNS